MAVLIIDYDGTIHDSMVIYEPSVRACYERFVAEGLMPERAITREEIETYIGLTARQMWDMFAPGFSDEQKERGSGIIRDELHRLTAGGMARLYDGVPEMLRTLKENGHRLVYLSACHISYKEVHTKYFHLDQYFDEMYCTEQFDWLPKYEIVRKLLDKWQQEPRENKAVEPGTEQNDSEWQQELKENKAVRPETDQNGSKLQQDLKEITGNTGSLEIVAIGDRFTDMEISRASDSIRTIWCSYGFGKPDEGKTADAVADNPAQIPELVSKLSMTI